MANGYDKDMALGWAALGRLVRGGTVERMIGHLACREAREAWLYCGGCDQDHNDNELLARFQMVTRD